MKRNLRLKEIGMRIITGMILFTLVSTIMISPSYSKANSLTEETPAQSYQIESEAGKQRGNLFGIDVVVTAMDPNSDILKMEKACVARLLRMELNETGYRKIVPATISFGWFNSFVIAHGEQAVPNLEPFAYMSGDSIKVSFTAKDASNLYSGSIYVANVYSSPIYDQKTGLVTGIRAFCTDGWVDKMENLFWGPQPGDQLSQLTLSRQSDNKLLVNRFVIW